MELTLKILQSASIINIDDDNVSKSIIRAAYNDELILESTRDTILELFGKGDLFMFICIKQKPTLVNNYKNYCFNWQNYTFNMESDLVEVIRDRCKSPVLNYQIFKNMDNEGFELWRRLQ